MSSVSSVSSGSAALPTSCGSAGSSSGELAKYEGQLSDWVHCPSAKTSAGKAKIAEITSKIDAIKADMKKAAEAKTPVLAGDQGSAQPIVAQGLRFDGTGAWLNIQA